MKNSCLLFLVCLAFAAHAADPRHGNLTGTPCSDAWNRSLDALLLTGDPSGHGPDLGSDEWKSVVEFKLSVRGKPGVPARESSAWCSYIDRLARAAKAPNSQGPSFDCARVKAGSTEALVCAEPELSALDRKLAEVYAAASRKAVNEHPPVLKAEQRGWIKGRNDCWKSPDQRECVRDEYVRRVAGLQARYRLVPSAAPTRLACDGDPRNEVMVTFFQTQPPTLIAERGDQTSLMYLQPDGWFMGRNEKIREQRGEMIVVWGYQAPEMRCKR
jgi:uncharacterized protein